MSGDDPETSPKDESMEDILASIRRIMVDEETRLKSNSPSSNWLNVPRSKADQPSAEPDPPRLEIEGPPEIVPPVLTLDDSMVVADQPPHPADDPVPPPSEAHVTPPHAAPGWAALSSAGHIPRAEEPSAAPEVEAARGPSEAPLLGTPSRSGEADAAPPMSALAIEALVAPAAAAAAAASVEALLRRLDQEGGPLNPRSAPTIEDVVRSELRPLLKSWLDENLPGLVERLVRAEIEKLVSRSLR
jgi:cell pole-organizing protein PopZ